MRRVCVCVWWIVIASLFLIFNFKLTSYSDSTKNSIYPQPWFSCCLSIVPFTFSISFSCMYVFSLNRQRISCIRYDLLPTNTSQCASPKKKGTFIHKYSTIINLSESALSIFCSSGDPVMSFLAFFPLQFGIQSRIMSYI